MYGALKYLFFVLIFCNAGCLYAFDVQQECTKGEWTKRLFYVNGKSLVTSKSFFLTSDGRENSCDELAESIKMLSPLVNEHGPIDQKNFNKSHEFICKFPSRFFYLAPKLGISDRKITCDDFKSWRDSFEAAGASLMFASQYLENPASSFGHTYLKLNSSKKSLFLNKVISYAATVPEKSGDFEYIWKGLTGGFSGSFSVNPFYVLFQEYANMEKRDLWEYELRLSKAQTDDLLAILYELINLAKFDYKFMSDNCSSLLLRLIDIEIGKDLIESLPYHVLPIETVKILAKKGFIKNTVFYPSITTRMVLKSKDMSTKEKNEVINYIYRNKKISKDASAKALDLALEYINFQRQVNAGKISKNKEKDFQHLLVQRARHGQNVEETVSSAKGIHPEKASSPQRISLGLMSPSNSTVLSSISFRPVGRDFLDRPNGYSRDSEINFVKTKISFDVTKSKFSYFNLDVIGIRKFSDYNLITNDISWGANLSVRSMLNRQPKKYFTEIDSHIGLGKELTVSFLAYFVIHPTFRAGNISQHLNLVPQAEIGGIFTQEDLVFKSSIFKGFIYNGLGKRYFTNWKTSGSYIISDDFSLSLVHDWFLNNRSWQSLEVILSYYF